MLQWEILESALGSAPKSAPGNRGAPGSAPESAQGNWAVLQGVLPRVLFLFGSTLEHPDFPEHPREHFREHFQGFPTLAPL